ncbi:MAG TPA: thioesterase family protein [Cyclobacteriaceae bacterium]|nr:thioesterase family protein [Cyclobacteriaceae bacterium]
MNSPIYHHTITVQPGDLDELNHVNNVVYLQWVQDAASAHWNAFATQAIKEKFFWVVLRHEINYKTPALLGDEIIAKTWVQDYQGAKSTRIVQLFRARDNLLLAEAKTLWCLMSRQTGRPTRIGEDIKEVFVSGT